MKRIGKKRCIMLLLLSCMVSGCGSAAEPVVDTGALFADMGYFPMEVLQEGMQIPLAEDAGAVWIHSAHVTDQGVFFFSQEEGLLKYEDWENGIVYPLCVKPNCLHDSDECTAWFPANKTSPEALYFDGEFLYFEKSGEYGETIFYRQNPDGSNRKQMFSQEGYLASGVVYDRDMVYDLTLVAKEDIEEGGGGVHMELEYRLYRGSLSGGRSEQLPYRWTVTMGDMILLGKYENRLVLRYSVQTGEVEDDGWPVTDEMIFLLDLDSGEIVGLGENITLKSDMFESDAIANGIFAEQYLDTDSDGMKTRNGFDYYPSSIVVESLKEGRAYQLPEQVWNIWDLLVADGKVFYYLPDGQTGEPAMAAYDLQVGTQLTFSPELGDFHIIGETKQWFYGMLYRENIPMVKVRILKSDFYVGIPAYIEILGEW